MPPTTPFKRDLLRLLILAWSVSAFDPLSGPNRSEFIAATGRAPIVKTSRRIPPTPVAAPWNGSIKLGWLCDSTLKATHQSSPISTTPAFSPGGTMTRGPEVGSRFRCTREDLYEQCSDHITLKMPSSVIFGSRPRISTIFWYSPGVRPCCSTISGVITASVIICLVLARKTKQLSYRVRPRLSISQIDGLRQLVGKRDIAV